MRRLTHVVLHVGRAADKCRYAPASQEYAHHHDEGNRDRGNTGVDHFDRRLGSAKPSTSSESAEYSQSLQSSQAARLHRSFDLSVDRVHAFFSLPQCSSRKKSKPATSTSSGIQKWMSRMTVLNRLSGRILKFLSFTLGPILCEMRLSRARYNLTSESDLGSSLQARKRNLEIY